MIFWKFELISMEINLVITIFLWGKWKILTSANFHLLVNKEIISKPTHSSARQSKRNVNKHLNQSFTKNEMISTCWHARWRNRLTASSLPPFVLMTRVLAPAAPPDFTPLRWHLWWRHQRSQSRCSTFDPVTTTTAHGYWCFICRTPVHGNIPFSNNHKAVCFLWFPGNSQGKLLW